MEGSVQPPEAERMRHAGSHLGSIQRIASGVVDPAAIDSSVLALVFRSDPRMRRLRVIESWRLHGVQAIVARSALAPKLRSTMASALLHMHSQAPARRILGQAGVLHFAPVPEALYEAEGVAWLPDRTNEAP